MDNSWSFMGIYVQKEKKFVWKEKRKKFVWKIKRFQEIVVSLHRKNSKQRKKMEAKDVTRQNPIRRLLEYKRAMRECIQRGADHEEMKKISKDYGFTLATPV